MSETKQFCDPSSKLTTSKTKQFCETSVKNGKLSAELTASYQCVLRFFQSMCLNYCACHEKWCQVIRSAAPVTQNNLSKPEDLMLQNATPLRKSEPGPPCHAKCIFADPLQMSHACHRFWKCYKTLTFCSLLRRCTIPCACHAKRHLNFQKWRGHGVLCTFWLRNVLRPTAAYLFRHLNFQKWGELGVFCTFWLRNVLRATTACTFSTSQLPKVVRSWCVLHILTSKCASRHNGVQLFARWLRTRRFSEPTFRPSGASNHRKNTVFRDFPTFSRICVFFLLTLSLLWSSLFYSSLLSDSSHPCFSSVHIVGSLTSKFPSIIPWYFPLASMIYPYYSYYIINII